MREEIQIFKKRAEEAFDSIGGMLEKGYYNWAIVMLEQALQLFLKYYLARELGYFSKTRNLRKLFEEAGTVDERFLDFCEKHRDAYIAGRYLPKRYSREDVEDKLNLYRELIEIVES